MIGELLSDDGSNEQRARRYGADGDVPRAPEHGVDKWWNEAGICIASKKSTGTCLGSIKQ